MEKGFLIGRFHFGVIGESQRSFQNQAFAEGFHTVLPGAGIMLRCVPCAWKWFEVRRMLPFRPGQAALGPLLCCAVEGLALWCQSGRLKVLRIVSLVNTGVSSSLGPVAGTVKCEAVCRFLEEGSDLQWFAGIGASNGAFAAPVHHQFRIQQNGGFPKKVCPKSSVSPSKTP